MASQHAKRPKERGFVSPITGKVLDLFVEKEQQANLLSNVIRQSMENIPLHLANFQHQLSPEDVLSLREPPIGILTLRDLEQQDAVFYIEGYVGHVYTCPFDHAFHRRSPSEFNQEIRLIGGSVPEFQAALEGLEHIIDFVNVQRQEGHEILLKAYSANDSIVATTPLMTHRDRNFFVENPISIPRLLPAYRSMSIHSQRGTYLYLPENHVPVHMRSYDQRLKDYVDTLVSPTVIQRGQLVRIGISLRGGQTRDLFPAYPHRRNPVIRLRLVSIKILSTDPMQRLRQEAEQVYKEEMESSLPPIKKRRIEV